MPKIKIYFSYFSTKMYVVGTQNKRRGDSSFEHPKYKLKLMGKKIFKFTDFGTYLAFYHPSTCMHSHLLGLDA